MLRLFTAIAFTIRANAQLPYTQQQAQSFQSLSRDVLAAIAPSIDPTYKLAAQTSLTFAEDEQADHWSLIQYAMGDSLTYSIVNTERVTSFRALVSASPDLIGEVVSSWAAVPFENVIVVKDTGDTGATPSQILRSLTWYNVTVLPQVNPLNARSPYVDQIDTAQGLIRDLPPNCFAEAACMCNILLAEPRWQDGCKGTFTNASVGIRFTIDVFTDFDVPNSVVSGVVTSRWLTRLPPRTLQASAPLTMTTPAPFSLSGTVIALLIVSGVLFAVAVLVWLKTR